MGNVPSRSWPSKRLPDQFGAPTNAQIGRVQDLSRPHPLNEATSAADILSDAVFYIDAQEHAAAGGHNKVIRNRGWGGSVLDARCGSTSVPDTNDPRFLAAEPTAYVYLPGVTSNYLSVPDATNLRITGDIDLQALVALDDWTPAAQSTLVTKYAFGGANDGYAFSITAAGALRLQWQESGGTTNRSALSTVSPTIGDGNPLWVRATLDVDNGASQYEVKFYTSTDGAAWTQLGSTITGSTGVTTINASTLAVGVGASSGGSVFPTAGRFYRAIVKDGINGTTVLDVDTSVLTTGSATSFTATTGQTVTINRSTSGRKTVVVPDRSRSGGCWLFGTDDRLTVLDNFQHGFFDLGTHQSFTVVCVARIWGTPANNQSYVSKGDPFSFVTRGWTLYNNGTSLQARTFLSQIERGASGTNNIDYTFGNTVNFTAGATSVMTGFYDRISGATATIVNGTQSTLRTIRLGNMTPRPALFLLRIGYGLNDSNVPDGYADMELMSVAYFRRALTAAEIATLTTAFQGRYA